MDPNPLKAFVDRLNAAVGFGFIVFICLNLVLLFAVCPSNFQRLGSAWVALAVFVFGSWRFFLAQLNLALDGRGMMFVPLNKMLDDVSIRKDKGWLNYVTKDGQAISNPPEHTEEEVARFLRDASAELEGRIFGPEWAMLFFGTLQWGYGDLLSAWINGERFATC